MKIRKMGKTKRMRKGNEDIGEEKRREDRKDDAVEKRKIRKQWMRKGGEKKGEEKRREERKDEDAVEKIKMKMLRG